MDNCSDTCSSDTDDLFGKLFETCSFAANSAVRPDLFAVLSPIERTAENRCPTRRLVIGLNQWRNLDE